MCHHNRIDTICLLLFFHYFGRNIFVELSHTLSFRHAFLAVSGLFYSTNIRVFSVAYHCLHQKGRVLEYMRALPW